MKRTYFTEVKGLSDQIVLVRKGKIHLGMKAISEKTGKEYPTATRYFVCPEEVKKVYGEKPTQLEILLPSDNPRICFPQAYKYYRKSVGLWCMGNGERAQRINDDGKLEEVVCPCDYEKQGECKHIGNFMFFLPRVTLEGVYQIDTGSIHSIININSVMKMICDLYGGRMILRPALLSIVEKEVTVDKFKKVVFVMKLTPVVNADFVPTLSENSRLILPPPIQQKYEEQDLIPQSVYEGDNSPIEVEWIPEAGPETRLADLLGFFHHQDKELSRAWEKTIQFFLAWGSWADATVADFLAFAETALGRANPALADLTIEDLRKIFSKAKKMQKDQTKLSEEEKNGKNP